eukprot:TRINITY_DN11732_c0_g1_i1.p1 TRINITY_DN11732_c0_g1~~TRINITY_DN11732_c0_g1_i1.p1  ORF type:complete len:144 (+),score=14.79 TRINITY_DN11732_c0_g1_i1:139-570(+)
MSNYSVSRMAKLDSERERKQFSVQLKNKEGELLKLNWSKKPIKPARFYGKFTCPNRYCDLNTWSSAFIWLGRGQKCKICDNLIPPLNVEELKTREERKVQITKTVLTCTKHDRTKCGYCIERRKNCTKIPSSEYGSYHHAIIK